MSHRLAGSIDSSDDFTDSFGGLGLLVGIGAPRADQSSAPTSPVAPAAAGGPPESAVFASISTLATYLVSGYWAYSGYDGTQPRHWASHTISVNISALTTAEQNLATAALQVWANVADLHFTFTTGAANITYNHNGGATQYVANTSDTTPVSGQNYQAETIDISTYWFNNDGGAGDGRTGYNSYNFQTYIHETGHALGLGHQGPYNGAATYGVDNIYSNDTWQWSIMSYMSQDNYGGADYDYVVTPQMADIYAIQQIYGANATAQAGDTVYGFHCTTGFLFNFDTYAGQNVPAFTIYDTSGIDTLDCSGYSMNQTIDLNPGHWSSIGGYVNNIGISTTSNIENAVGGSGNDLIIANNALASTLTGGGGNDTFQLSPYGWGGSTITDMSIGDRIDSTGLDYSAGTFYRHGTALTIAGYGGNLSNNPTGHLVMSNDGSGGSYLSLTNHDVYLNDFNGDGHSDMLWRNTNGTFTVWDIAGNSLGNSISSNVFVGNTDPSWQIQGTLDFNGDSNADLLFRNTASGTFTIWNASGSSFAGNAYVCNFVDNSWSIAAMGDFNGDGRGDLLFRNAGGTFTEWQSTGTGFTPNVFVNSGVDSSWHLQGVGDFNGDGRDDLIWRNNSGLFTEWQSNGSGFNANVYIGAGVDTTWHLAAFGDFNGDGRTDILFRNNNGLLTEWQSTGSGFNANVYVTQVDPSFQIAGIGDFNDDGRDDIIFRNGDGITTTWQSTGNAFNANVLAFKVTSDWSVVTHHYDVV